jgi:hypothetical protein
MPTCVCLKLSVRIFSTRGRAMVHPASAFANLLLSVTPDPDEARKHNTQAVSLLRPEMQASPQTYAPSQPYSCSTVSCK